MYLRRLIRAAGLAVAGLAVAAPGEETTFDLEVQTGSVARIDAPVAVSLPQPFESRSGRGSSSGPLGAWVWPESDAAAIWPGQLEIADGHAIAHFILEGDYEAGKTLKARLHVASAGPTRPGPAFTFAAAPDSAEDLLWGDQPIWRYRRAFDPNRLEATYKVFHELFDFSGAGMITKPEGGTYPHHRGLFIGWNKTSAQGRDYDFWHMKPDGTTQRHAGFLDERTLLGPVLARRAMRVDWLNPEGTLLIEETRTLTAYRQRAGARLIDAESHLQSGAGEIRLDGDAHHAGFQFRAAQEVFENQKETVYLLPEGAERRENDLATGAWAAALFPFQGRRLAAVYLAHPGNPERATAILSVRPYVRFGEFFPATLRPGAPLRLRYRLYVLDFEPGRAPTAEAIQALYEGYAEPPRARILLP